MRKESKKTRRTCGRRGAGARGRRDVGGVHDVLHHHERPRRRERAWRRCGCGCGRGRHRGRRALDRRFFFDDEFFCVAGCIRVLIMHLVVVLVGGWAGRADTGSEVRSTAARAVLGEADEEAGVAQTTDDQAEVGYMAPHQAGAR
ncbi:hypothetical protein DFH09DRAFT_1086250 [Mycena vulgaris]|nr:hypothetical protein DFH09DRAFT_1086250 [Mycena vulgaris]